MITIDKLMPHVNGIRVVNNTVVISIKGGNDKARIMCKRLVDALSLYHASKSTGRKPPEHSASENCWCQPEVDYVDPETGAAMYVHKSTQ